MPFNLNKLVQPECGAPNPLVSVARQIAMRPSTSTSASIIRPHGQQAPVGSFIKEFLEQQTNNQQISGTTKIIDKPARLHPNVSTNPHVVSNAYFMNYNRPYYPHIQSNYVNGGDQLEAKYKSDMLAQQNEEKMNKLSMDGAEQKDDLEFWQALSQEYIGPTASPVVRPQVSSDYIFDDRNPLKDQFEDPFAEGIKKLEQGDIPSAALLFEAAVQKNPNDATAWFYLGTTQAQNEKDMSAIRALKNCLSLDQSNQEARLAIAVSLANETYYHETCRILIEWLINHQKYSSLAGTMVDFENLDNENSIEPFHSNASDGPHCNYVLNKLVEAARMSPNNPDPDVQTSLGVLCNMRGEYGKAVDCFKAALSVKSDDSLLWNRLGATLANGNRSAEAVVAYKRALEIAPGFLRSRYNLAISLIHLNIYDEAAKQLVHILNTQAAGKGSANPQIRTRSVTSAGIWNTLRTVATLMNKPDLYPIIDGRDLNRCNEEIMKGSGRSDNI